LEGDVARLAHPHESQLISAGPALAVRVADEGLQPLEAVAQQRHVIAHLQQYLGLSRRQLPKLGQHRPDRRLRHGCRLQALFLFNNFLNSISSSYILL